MVLRVYIDKEGGIGLDDCQEVSGLLDEKLEELNIINDRYILEVSSPGLDRALKKKKILNAKWAKWWILHYIRLLMVKNDNW